MPKKSYSVEVDGESIPVIVSWSWVDSSGEIQVGGRVVDAWGLDWNLQQREFLVGGKTAIARWKGLIPPFIKFDLIVDGFYQQ